MLRFLFCSAVIAPIFFLPGLIGGNDAVASVEDDTNSYVEFTNRKLDMLEDCEAEAISVYFHDEYVTTHSAQYLQSAVDAASECQNMDIRLIGLQHDEMDRQDIELAEMQLSEVAEFVKAYEVDAQIDTTERNVDMDSRAVNGRSVVVEFDFD